MTNQAQHPKKPSAKQHRYLRRLAEQRGVSFAYPATSTEASGEIERLLAIPKSDRGDRRRDIRVVRDAMAPGGNLGRFTDDEFTSTGGRSDV